MAPVKTPEKTDRTGLRGALPQAPKTAATLRLYHRVVAPCFSTAAERARALGISETAIRKWDRGELNFVKRASAQRVIVIARTCRSLERKFSHRSDVGTYLLHEVLEADRRIRPLDLVIEGHDPQAAVELLEATRAATVSVVRKRLSPDALTDEAWANVFAPQSDDERELEEELIALDEMYDIPAAL
jgi:hypothetical protein